MVMNETYGLALLPLRVMSIGYWRPGLRVSFRGEPLTLGTVARKIIFPLWFHRTSSAELFRL
jgi:hypothetical protein